MAKKNKKTDQYADATVTKKELKNLKPPLKPAKKSKYVKVDPDAKIKTLRGTTIIPKDLRMYLFLNNKFVSYKYYPSMNLIDFAIHFSQSYLKLKEGEYRTVGDEYIIKYFNKINSNLYSDGDAMARVSDRTGIIEFSKDKFKNPEFTNDFVFYLILWFDLYFKSKTRNYKMTDKVMIDYYLNTNRSVKNLIKGYSVLFKHNPCDMNKERIKQIKEILDNYKKKKNKNK